MIVDYLRSGCTCQMRLHAGSDRLTTVRWYKAAPGAQELPIPTALRSTMWNNAVWEVVNPDIGMQAGIEYAPDGVIVPPPGTEFHGDPDWWVNGIPPEHWSDPVTPCVIWPNDYCLLQEGGGDILIEDSPGCIQIEH